MRPMRLSVLSAGIVTDAIESVAALAGGIGSSAHWSSMIPRAQILESATVAGQDALSQLALRAAHQAWTMAGMSDMAGERVGLLVQTAWGAIDSTQAYLDSMFEVEGRYASPRHFSRSVYSSVASATAIQFHVQGPCETLAFDGAPLLGALRQAWRLLAMDRAERVMLVWCEQGGELAADLAEKAAVRLHRREFERFGAEGLGFGAVAMVVGREEPGCLLDLDAWDEDSFRATGIGKRFAMDSAVAMLQTILRK